MKKSLSVLAASAVVASLSLIAVPPAQASHRSDASPCTKRLISAHEGFTAHADGDTVESQQAAFRIGANIADSDVWMTDDDYFVEMHDDDVSYSTNGTGLVSQMRLSQILALRTKYWDDPVPTLDDSLAIPVASDAGRWEMFETKFEFENTDYLDWLADAITAAGMTDHVIIYSAYLDQVRYLKQIDPDLTVWFKAETSVPDPSQVEGLNGVMIPSGMLNATVTQEFHDIGLTVIRERVGSENATAWNNFVASGADGLMTANPRVAIAECKALPGRPRRAVTNP
jgi:glycerophosphoryl diester phosphodiesterase